MKEHLPALHRALVKYKGEENNSLHTGADSLTAHAWAALRWHRIIINPLLGRLSISLDRYCLADS